ncbi:MAG TPA: hypothetical protein VGJ84_05420 [Polyangiaceae bacterium]
MATVLFALVVSGFTLVWSVQIAQQIWFVRAPPAAVGCSEGLAKLADALHRAKRAAGAETGGERASLARFRQALEPEWSWLPGLEQKCQKDEHALSVLHRLDRLRYAEEHAVRYEAVDTARQRRSISSE